MKVTFVHFLGDVPRTSVIRYDPTITPFFRICFKCLFQYRDLPMTTFTRETDANKCLIPVDLHVHCCLKCQRKFYQSIEALC